MTSFMTAHNIGRMPGKPELMRPPDTLLGDLTVGAVRHAASAAKPDPLLVDLSNAEIESLAAHFASLR